MANLEEPICDEVPVAQQLVVARDTEVEGTPNTEQCAGIPRAVAACPRIRESEIEGELALQIYQRIADRSETLLLELRKGFGFYLPKWWDLLWALSQNVRSQHIKLGGLIDRL